MATFTDKLALLITADSSQAVSQLRKVGNAAETNLSQAELSGSKFEKVLGGIGSVAPVAGAALLSLGVIAVKTAVAGEAATARLDTAITNAGQSTDAWTPKIQGTADAMAKLGFNQDDVHSSIARLIPATHSVADALKLQIVAANLARARNIDLGSATDLLVKAESGHYTQLGRLGIATKAQIAGFKTSADAIDFLANTYKGSALTYSKQFAGQLEALKAEAHNLTESIGQELIPVLSQYVGGLQKIVQTGTLVERVTSKAGLTFGHLGDSILKSLPGVEELSAAQSVFGSSQSKAADGAKELAKDIKAVTDATSVYTADLTSGHATRDQLAKDSKAVADANSVVANIQNQVNAATQQGTDAADASTAAINKEKAADDALATSLKHLNDDLLASANASIAAQQATLQVGDAATTYANKLALLTGAKKNDAVATRDAQEAGLALNSAILSAIAASEAEAKAHVDATSAATGSALAIEEETAKHKAAEVELKYLKTLYPQLSSEIDAYAKSLNLIPTSVNTHVLVNGKEVPVTSAAVLNLQPGNRRAGGGPVTAGDPYLVGEKGPELFVPGQSGTILPHGRSARGAASITVNVTVNGAQSPEGVVQAFRQWVRSNGAREINQLLSA